MTCGPFATEAEARAYPPVRAACAAFDFAPGAGRLAELLADVLAEVCAAAGVELGRYDTRVLAWLAGWPPGHAAVIASLITRAA